MDNQEKIFRRYRCRTNKTIKRSKATTPSKYKCKSIRKEEENERNIRQSK